MPAAEPVLGTAAGEDADELFDRAVAIKVLPADFAQSAQLRLRFEREAKTISQLNHPHICTLHDVGREGDTDYLVMEYIPGATLSERVARGMMWTAFTPGIRSSRPIRLVLGVGTGGVGDVSMRLAAQQMSKSMGQTIVVENVTGAGGSIGVGRVARAAPDGYTVSIGHWGTHVVNGAYYNLNYDLHADFVNDLTMQRACGKCPFGRRRQIDAGCCLAIPHTIILLSCGSRRVNRRLSKLARTRH